METTTRQLIAGYVVLLSLIAYLWLDTHNNVEAMSHGPAFRIVEAHDDYVELEAMLPPRFACKSSLANLAKKGQVIHCHAYSHEKAKETGHSFYCEGGTWNLDLKVIHFDAENY